MTIRQHLKYLPVYLFFITLMLLTINFPFFWDTIQLASKQADFFYRSDFNSIILPNDLDSGHIPALGMYLAVIWKVTGRSLVISHLAMFPFVMGIIYQSIFLVRKIFNKEWHYYALILILADATLLAQCTLVSPDILVVFFFLYAINNLLLKKRIWYAVALAGLVLSSMRGMMCVAGLFIAEIVILFTSEKDLLCEAGRKNVSTGVFHAFQRYILSIMIAGAFFAWHYHITGWIGYHNTMPWYPLFESVDFKDAVYNTLIMGWRLIDFGRIFIWAAGAFCLWHYYINRPLLPVIFKSLFIILICITFTLSYALIFHKNLSGHRYLLPVYILFTIIIVFYLYELFNSNKLKKMFFYILILGLLTGNIWVYPDNIAKGWDSTLAYLPYFPLRDKMMKYMKSEGIKLSETGTDFPNEGKLDNIDLSGNNDSFADLDLKTNHYVFYSNVYNGISDQELFELKNRWTVVKEFRFLMVKIILYVAPGVKSH